LNRGVADWATAVVFALQASFLGRHHIHLDEISRACQSFFARTYAKRAQRR
jgi:hypothetical protein